MAMEVLYINSCFFFLGVVVVFVVIVEFFDKTIIICQVYFRALKLEDLQ